MPGCVVATPVISPDSHDLTEVIDVTITCATDGATIRYTTDNSTPTESSLGYTAPIRVADTTVVKAIGFKDGMLPSKLAVETYTGPPVRYGLNPLDPKRYLSIPLATAPRQGKLPSSCDLSKDMPSVGEQGDQPSCVGWAIAYALKTYQERTERFWDPNPDEHLFSPAYIYNQVTVGECNSGADFIEGFNVLTEQGCSTLATMPYDAASCDAEPSDDAKAEADQYRAAYYRRINVQDPTEIRAHLAAGYPIVMGMRVHSHFKFLRGQAIYDDVEGYQQEGEHALCVVGYDDNPDDNPDPNKSMYKVLNSWGPGWGQDGYFWITYDLFKDVVFEAYVAQDFLEDKYILRVDLQGHIDGDPNNPPPGDYALDPPGATHDPGARVTVTVYPDEGYMVKSWSGTDDDTSTATTNTVTVNDPITEVTVGFGKISPLAGTWDFHMVTSGDSPQWTGWVHALVTADVNGDVDFISGVGSDGDITPPPPSMSLAVSNSGEITAADGSDFHGVMTSDRDMLVGVVTDGGGGSTLLLGTKRTGVSFTSDDLVGTWDVHALYCQGNDTDFWLHGTLEGNANAAEYTELFTAQAPLDVDGLGWAWSISSDGVITFDEYNWIGCQTADYHVMLNSRKDVAVGVETVCDTNHEFFICSKRGETVFSNADMVGTWSMHGLIPGDMNTWVHGTVSADATDQARWTEATTRLGPANVADMGGNTPFSVSSGGIITADSLMSHGVIHVGKDLAVWVGGSGEDSPMFLVGVKQSDTPQAATDPEGVNLANTDLTDTQGRVVVYAGGPYEVFASNDIPPFDDLSLDYYLTIDEQSEYRKLGWASTSASFPGGYKRYIFITKGVFYLDSVRRPDGTYAPSRVDRGTKDYPNIEGPPDGISATVGRSADARTYVGFVLIENNS